MKSQRNTKLNQSIVNAASKSFKTQENYVYLIGILGKKKKHSIKNKRKNAS